MKKQITKENYLKRVHRIQAYIHQNLDGPLTFEEVAAVACLSPSHWYRIYKSLTGETVTHTIKRLRLQRAAKALIDTRDPLSQIGRQAGYSSTDSFARAFKETYQTSPRSYREKGQHLVQEIFSLDTNPTEGLKDMYDVTTHDQAPLRLATMDHKGSYMKIGQVFEQLMTQCAHRGLMTPESRSFGVYYDDPNTVRESELRSKAALTLPHDAPCPDEFDEMTLPAGRYGQLTHKGPYSELETVYNWLYKVWLLESGYEPADAPVVEEYLNNPREVVPTELLTVINIPLKSEAKQGQRESRSSA